MRIPVYIILSLLLFLQCNRSSEAEDILDEWMIQGIDNLLRSTKHNIDYSRSREKIEPIFEVFKEEIQAKGDLTKSIYSLDTLLKGGNNPFFNEDSIDSTYSILQNPSTSLIIKKKTLLDLLSDLFYHFSYQLLICQPEKIGVVVLDTIYYPRNKIFHFSKVLSKKSKDTLQVIDIAHQDENFINSRDSISTFTEKNFITVPLKMKHRNPVTKNENAFRSKLVIAVFDQ